jgi:hypothetical protein
VQCFEQIRVPKLVQTTPLPHHCPLNSKAHFLLRASCCALPAAHILLHTTDREANTGTACTVIRTDLLALLSRAAKSTLLRWCFRGVSVDPNSSASVPLLFGICSECLRLPSDAIFYLSRAKIIRKLSEEEEEEIIRLPWRGQCGRAAAGCARAAAALRC